MSEINARAQLETPLGTISFNPTGSATDYYWLTNVAGLDQAPLRVSTDPRPQAPGVILHKTLRDARHVTIEGLVVSASVTQRNTLMDDLTHKLESIEQVDGTWRWFPTGSIGGVQRWLTIRCDVNVEFTGGLGGGPKSFVFGLIAANPAISGVG